MATSEEDGKFCRNCHQKISATSWLLHEARCARINTVCTKCSEVVLKVNLDEHNEEYHREEPCRQCGQFVEKYMMDKHETELCSKVPMECTYCKLHIILSDFVQHEEYCGSQTEPCSDCLRPICRKDMLKHLTECTGEPVKVQPSSSNNDAYFSDGYDSASDMSCRKLCAVICCLCCCWSCLCCCWNKFKLTRDL